MDYADLPDLFLAHAKEPQLLFIGALGVIDRLHLGLAHALLQPLNTRHESHIIDHGGPNLRTVQSGQYLILPDQGARRIVAERVDPSVEDGLEPVEMIVVPGSE